MNRMTTAAMWAMSGMAFGGGGGMGMGAGVEPPRASAPGMGRRFRWPSDAKAVREHMDKYTTLPHGQVVRKEKLERYQAAGVRI